MKRYILFLTCITISLAAYSQDYSKYLKIPSITNTSFYIRHCLNPDGSTLLVSEAAGFPNPVFYVTMLDPSGQVVWVKKNELSYFWQADPAHPSYIHLLPNGNYRVSFEMGSGAAEFSLFIAEIDGTNGSVLTYKRMPEPWIGFLTIMNTSREDNTFTRIVTKNRGSVVYPDTTCLLRIGTGLTLDNSKRIAHPGIEHLRACYIRTVTNRDIVAITGRQAGITGTLLVETDLTWQNIQNVKWIPGIQIIDGFETATGDLYFSIAQSLNPFTAPGVLALYPDLSFKWANLVMTEGTFPKIFYYPTTNTIWLYTEFLDSYELVEFDLSGNYIGHRSLVGRNFYTGSVRVNAAGNVSFLSSNKFLNKIDDLNNVTSCNAYPGCGSVVVNRAINIYPGTASLVSWNPVWDNGFLVSSAFVPGFTNDTCYTLPIVNTVLDTSFQLSSDTICFGDSIHITGNVSNPAVPSWEINGTFIPDSMHNFYYTPLAAGHYIIKKIVRFGSCIDSSAQSYTVLPAPATSFSDTLLCQGEVLNLSYTGPGQVVWPNGSSGNNYSISLPGTYVVQVNNAGCTTIDSFIFTTPDLSFTLSDDSICAGDSLWVQSMDSLTIPYYWTVNNMNYAATHNFWFNPAGAGAFRIDKYIQEATCTDTFSLWVNVLPAPLSPAFPDTILCEGQNITYTYPFTGMLTWPDGSAGNSFTVNTAGNYTLIVREAICATMDTWNIGIIQLPSDFLPGDTNICKGAGIELVMPSGFNNHGWNDSLPDLVINITDSAYIFLTVYDQHCSSTDSIFIDTEICIDCEMFVPDAFTPNFDLDNPLFYPVTNCRVIKEYTFRIFDRWGKEIFHTDQISQGWDGLDFPIGIYVYHIDAVLYNGLTDFSYSLTGRVSLIR